MMSRAQGLNYSCEVFKCAMTSDTVVTRPHVHNNSVHLMLPIHVIVSVAQRYFVIPWKIKFLRIPQSGKSTHARAMRLITSLKGSLYVETIGTRKHARAFDTGSADSRLASRRKRVHPRSIRLPDPRQIQKIPSSPGLIIACGDKSISYPPLPPLRGEGCGDAKLEEELHREGAHSAGARVGRNRYRRHAESIPRPASVAKNRFRGRSDRVFGPSPPVPRFVAKSFWSIARVYTAGCCARSWFPRCAFQGTGFSRIAPFRGGFRGHLADKSISRERALAEAGGSCDRRLPFAKGCVRVHVSPSYRR